MARLTTSSVLAALNLFKSQWCVELYLKRPRSFLIKVLKSFGEIKLRVDQRVEN